MALSMRGVPLRGISLLVARPSVRARARIMVAKVSGVTVQFPIGPYDGPTVRHRTDTGTRRSSVRSWHVTAGRIVHARTPFDASGAADAEAIASGGSTGKPKLIVMPSAFAYAPGAHPFAGLLGLNSDDGLYSPGPLYHSRPSRSRRSSCSWAAARCSTRSSMQTSAWPR